MKPTTDLALVLLGLIAWIVAGLIAVAAPTVAVRQGNGTAEVANVAAAGAACGFAIAGGLCLLGAAVTSKDDIKPRPRSRSGPEADYRDPPS